MVQMAWSQVTPGCNIQQKKSSVLAFFRHTFVVSDIFGSEKILCPAWVLGSAALLLAALSVENPGSFMLLTFEFVCSLRFPTRKVLALL